MLSPRQIEIRVKKLLSELGIVKARVPIRKIAKSLGATIRSEPFEGDISGALYRSGDEKVIGINALDAKTRQRFTIAHEIGHLVLHADPVYLDRGHLLGVVPNDAETLPAFSFLRNQLSSEAKDPSEIEANRFAASLLMPQDFLASDLKQKTIPVTEDEIEALADKYQVSYQAMTFRLMNLGAPMETVPQE